MGGWKGGVGVDGWRVGAGGGRVEGWMGGAGGGRVEGWVGSCWVSFRLSSGDPVEDRLESNTLGAPF